MFERVTTLFATVLLLAGCDGRPASEPPPDRTGEGRPEKIVKSDEEWRDELTPEQYRIARKGGTEPAFTGKYWNTKEPGTYVCACCAQELFSSETKFDSGSGWPSFWEPVAEEKVAVERDVSLGMAREEVLCSRCGAHLGHVFPDGPEPTGLRYCVNSASLDLKEKEEE